VSRRASQDPWRAPEESTAVLRVLSWLLANSGPFYRLFAIEPVQFRELLRVRVLLAQRPVRGGANVWGVAGIAVAVLWCFAFGLMTGIVALVADDASVWIVASQTGLGLLLLMLLFQYLAAILVDPTDIHVVAAHPVDDRTLFAVRLAEMFGYLLAFVASFTLGNVVLAAFVQPLLGVLLVYPVLSVLCGLTALGSVALLFALCLRLVGAAYFQRVTLWVQILGGTLLFGGLQLSRVLRREQWGLWADEHRELLVLWPPFQYADLYARLTGHAEGTRVWSSVAAVLVPVLGLVGTLWLASRSFVAGLQGTLGPATTKERWPLGTMERLGRRLGSGTQRIGFDFAAALSRREPHYLRTVLPQLVIFQAMALGTAFGIDRDTGFFIPFSAAFLVLALPNVFLQAEGTAEPDAREVFLRSPVASMDDLLRGGLKALLVQWIGGSALVLLAVQTLVAGPEALPRIVLALMLASAFTLFLARRYDLAVPFTRPVRIGVQGAANFGLVVLSGLVVAVECGLYWLLTLHQLATWGGIAVAVWAVRAGWKGLDRVVVPEEKILRPARIPLAPQR